MINKIMNDDIWFIYPKVKKDTARINGKVIADILECHFIDSLESLKFVRSLTGKKYPRIAFTGLFFCFTKFVEWREILFDCFENADKFIVIRDEYQKFADVPKRYCFGNHEVWTSIRHIAGRDRFHYVNLNMLASSKRLSNSWNMSRPGLFYYGTLRKDRVEVIKKYFVDTNYPVNVACSKGELIDWVSTNKNANFFKFSETNKFNIFQMSIYIEDTWMKENDCSISRRFYECINSGVPLLFDSATISNFERYKINIFPDWIVENKKDVFNKLKESEKIQSAQQKEFSMEKFYLKIKRDFLKLCKEREVL